MEGASVPEADRAPEPAPSRRPPGLMWATALAAVVIVAALSVAVRNPGTASSPPPVSNGTGPVASGSGRSLVGAAAPAIVVDDFPLDPDAPPGPAHDVSSMRGRPVVVNFWASYCTPCRTEMPAFQQVHSELGDRVAFLGVNVSDGAAEARFLARSTGVSYPLGRDGRGTSLLAVGGTSLPVTVVIDRDGIVRLQRAAEVSADELRAALAPLLA